MENSQTCGKPCGKLSTLWITLWKTPANMTHTTAYNRNMTTHTNTTNTTITIYEPNSPAPITDATNTGNPTLIRQALAHKIATVIDDPRTGDTALTKLTAQLIQITDQLATTQNENTQTHTTDIPNETQTWDGI